MVSRRRNRQLTVAAIVLGAAGAATLFANTPAEQCVRKQNRILVATAYRELPERAITSARIMCERNGNVPESIFR